jgi:hypothetical protein
MKEFISVIFILICGIVAYGLFSSKSVADDSTSIRPTQVTPILRQCYGTVDITTGKTSNVEINCADDSNNNSIIDITNGSANCGSNQVQVGITFTVGSKYCAETGCGCNWEGSDCNSCCDYANSVSCYAVCAPLSGTFSVSNCGWK